MAGAGANLNDTMELASEHHAAGRLGDAEALYRSVLDARPKHPMAVHNLGLIALRIGRLDVAQFLAARAVSIRPDIWTFHNTQGEVFRVLGRHADALAAFDRAIALAPLQAVAQNNRGHALQSLGQPQQAEVSFRRALEIEPDCGEALTSLGLALALQGRTTEADGLFRRALAGDPRDPYGVALLLAALGRSAPPDRASSAHLARLYGGQANAWELGRDGLEAELVAATLRARTTPALDILDIGCGAGRVGALLRPIARSLVGVDLSASLLELAARRRDYTSLQQLDLLEFLEAQRARFDAAACAATLIHFGDLVPAFQAVAGALRPGGLFVLTLIANEADPASFAVGPITGMAQAGMFLHGRQYVADAAAGAGFEVLSLTDMVHNDRNGPPAKGLLIALQAGQGPGPRSRIAP